MLACGHGSSRLLATASIRLRQPRTVARSRDSCWTRSAAVSGSRQGPDWTTRILAGQHVRILAGQHVLCARSLRIFRGNAELP
jgi:hypothetical protein